MKKYVPSKIQQSCECYICHKPASAGLDHHHAIPARNRAKCDKYGLWVWLCRECHSKLHDTGDHDKEIRAIAQETFIRDMKKQGYPEEIAREEWLREFGKFYS